VARRFSGGTDEVELTLVGTSGDLAYSVGFERDQVSVDHAPPQEMILRVTQVYRRIDARWWVVHRHADVLPDDQRKTHP
jgi:ketosteroid isomerase-like protein